MTTPATTGTKRCTGPCGRVLHVLAFASEPGTHDGLRGHCRDCVSEYNHARWVETAKRPHNFRLIGRP